MKHYNFLEKARKKTRVSFSILQKQGPEVKNNLLEKTGMTLSTFNRVVQPLEEAGIIVDIGETVSTGGRKPHLFDVNREKPLFVGVEITEKNVSVGIVNLKAEILSTDRFSISREITPFILVEKVVASIRKLTREIDAYISDISAMGIAVDGVLDRENGVIISGLNLPKFKDQVPIKELFENVYDFPVYLDHAVYAASVAEYLFGIGAEGGGLTYIKVDDAVRAATINNGKLIRAAGSRDDIFGHMIVDNSLGKCSCGKTGCLLNAVSEKVIIEKYKKSALSDKTKSITANPDDITFADIADAAEKGDVDSVNTITEAGRYLGIGLYNYISLLNPGTVILAGSSTYLAPLLYKTAVETARTYLSMSGKSDDFIFLTEGKFADGAVLAGIVSVIFEIWIRSGIV